MVTNRKSCRPRSRRLANGPRPTPTNRPALKEAVRHFWEEAACGEDLYLTKPTVEGYEEHARRRYQLEPYIEEFARFGESSDRTVLEIGVGLGADHQRFAEAGAKLVGVDLTAKAVAHVRQRLEQRRLQSTLLVADSEALPFPNESFEFVWAWGVIHHTPDTERAAREIMRVLQPGGEFRVMVYHRYSIVGIMLWLRYGLLRLRPFTTLSEVYSHYMESPGTKAFTRSEARALFSDATDLTTSTVLTHGDLLSSEAGQRHRGPLLHLARRIWPRRIIRTLLPHAGLFLLVRGRK